MLLGFFLVFMVLGASGGSAINEYLVDIRNTTLISVRSTARSSYQLDLSGLGLRQINKTAFTNATSIRILNLANNCIDVVRGSVFRSLRNLQHLSLADNAIKRFAGAFAGLGNLKTLDISNNPIKVLEHGALRGMNKTIDIFVLGNSLKKISTDLFDADKSFRKISTEDEDDDEYAKEYEDDDANVHEEEVAKSQWRFKVCIDQGKVTILERVWSNEVLQAGCSLLKDDANDVHMNNLGIKEFERGWYRLPNDRKISKITLSDNDIVRVTDEMLNDLPASVRTVDLSNNKIERLEQGVIVNAYINLFDLSNNLISVIEEEALAGMNLWRLNLTENLLKDTSFMTTVPLGLKQLFLNGNQIVECTSDHFMNFNRLLTVELTDNRITILRNNSLRGLPYLFDLDLSRNRIGTLEPGCFRGLKALRNLKLRDNEIGDLDAGVFEDLSHLGRLDLGGNRLTRITVGFRNSLPRDLDNLDLDRNEIGSLENGTFVDVPKRSLNLENNRITSIAKGSFVVPGHNRLAVQLTAAESVTLPMKHKGIGLVNLSGNPVGRLENGALFGLRRGRHYYVYAKRNSIELIQGGLFDDGNQ